MPAGSETRWSSSTPRLPVPAHATQVIIYVYSLPRALDQCGEIGQVTNSSHVVNIPVEAVGPAFSQTVTGLMSRLASRTPARLLPSSSECRSCEITAEACSLHMNDESWPAYVTDHTGPKRPYTEGNRWKL